MKGIPLQHLKKGQSPKPDKSSSPPSFWERDISFGSGLGGKDRLELYQMLGRLLKAGLTLIESLEVLEDQARNRKLQELLAGLRHELEAGQSFSACLAAYPRLFSAFEIQSLRMGEQSGNMAGILLDLAKYFQNRLSLQRKVIQAFSYPIAVIVIAFLVLGFMIGYVVPMFEDVFSRFDAELPQLTQVILAISNGLRDHFFLWFPAVLLTLGLGWGLSRFPKVRYTFARLLLRLPVFGKLFLRLHMARLCYSLGLLLSARLNLDQALALLGEAIRFVPLQHALAQVEKEVIAGRSLYEAVAKESIFPRFFVQIVKVGEKTARLADMLQEMAESLEEESQAGIQTLTQFIEPLLIIFLGITVGVILAAMYLPMFSLSQAVGG